MIKDQRNYPLDLKPENTELLQSATKIPVPLVIAAWDEEDGTSMRVIKWINGKPLNKAWPGLTELEERILPKRQLLI